MTIATKPRIFDPVSLDVFDEIIQDGTADIMRLKALDMVEMYPGSTAKELLHYGHDRGMYSSLDPNQISPRLTDLSQPPYCLIVKCEKRPCTISKKSRKVNTYKRVYLQDRDRQPIQLSSMPKAIATTTHPSSEDPDKLHGSILYESGLTHCECMGFSKHRHCKGTIGLKIARYGVQFLNSDEKEYLRRRI